MRSYEVPHTGHFRSAESVTETSEIFLLQLSHDAYSDIFYKVFGSLGRLSKSIGRTIHRITENSQPDSILGTRWSVRIKNEMGDFEGVRNGSVEYYLYERPPISDFAPAGAGKFFPCQLKQEPLLICKFVRDTGCHRQYLECFPL